MALAMYALDMGTLGGGGFTPEAPLVQDDIVFNGLGLQNDVIVTEQTNIDDAPFIDFITFNNPRLDGGGIIGHYYRDKDIQLKGIIKINDTADLNDYLDYFKQQVNIVEGDLDIKVNDTYRRTQATPISINFNRKHYNLEWIDYELVLRTVVPYFYDTSINGQVFSTQTVSPIADEIINNGSAISYPQVIFTFAGSGNSGVNTITFTCNNTTITVSESISNGDILNINCDTKNVLLNGADKDYTGVFPYFDTGGNNFTITINGTFDVDINFIYKTNYL